MREGATGTPSWALNGGIMSCLLRGDGIKWGRRELKEAKDMCKKEIARDLRRESGWDEAAEANVDLEIGPVLDTGMVQEAVEVGGDILPLVVQARCPCCGQPFY